MTSKTVNNDDAIPIGTPRPIRQVGSTPWINRVYEYVRNSDILLGGSKYAKNEFYGVT